MNEVLAEQFRTAILSGDLKAGLRVISKVGIKDEEFLNSIVTRISLDFESGVFNSIEKPSKDLFLLAKACFSPLGGLINQVAPDALMATIVECETLFAKLGRHLFDEKQYEVLIGLLVRYCAAARSTTFDSILATGRGKYQKSINSAVTLSGGYKMAPLYTELARGLNVFLPTAMASLNFLHVLVKPTAKREFDGGAKADFFDAVVAHTRRLLKTDPNAARFNAAVTAMEAEFEGRVYNALALYRRYITGAGIEADSLTALFVARFRALAKDLYDTSTYLAATDKILPALAEAGVNVTVCQTLLNDRLMLRWESDQLSEQEFMAAVDAQSEAAALGLLDPVLQSSTGKIPGAAMADRLLAIATARFKETPFSNKALGAYLRAWRASSQIEYRQALLGINEAIPGSAVRDKRPVAASSQPAGIACMTSYACTNSIGMAALPLRELKRMGWVVGHHAKIEEYGGGTLPFGMAGHFDAKRQLPMKPVDLQKIRNSGRVEIDFPNRIVSIDGVNYYQGVYEFLSVLNRCFTIDITTSRFQGNFEKIFARVIAAHEWCENVFDSTDGEIPIRLLSANAHLAPFSVYRDYCLQKGYMRGINFVAVVPSYENYVSNLKSRFSTKISVGNLNDYPNWRSPIFARADAFEKWYALKSNFFANKDSEKYINVARIKPKRKADQPNTTRLDKFLQMAQDKQMPIICMAGKIPCDAGVLFDGGPAHRDMQDWLNHTIQLSKELGLALIVKPHPHELRPEIARCLNESFSDLIREELSENILLLRPDEVNFAEIHEYLDALLLWNGSAGLEFLANGLPVVMSGYFGGYDYPIDFRLPRDRDDYRRILAERDWGNVSVEKANRAKGLIEYNCSAEVMINYDYFVRAATNDKVGMKKWNEVRVESWKRYGHENVDRAVERIIGNGAPPADVKESQSEAS
jgi:hypothetical protein